MARREYILFDLGKN